MVGVLHRPFRFAFSIALSPAGIVRPLATSCSAFSLLIFDQMLRAPRGVNFCSHASESWACFCTSIQP